MTGRSACELAIVGAGPAGLAAATLAAEIGMEAVVFDEQPAPGGQAYRNVEAAASNPGKRAGAYSPPLAQGLALAQAFRGSRAGYEPGSAIWQVTATGKLGVSQAGRAYLTQARRVILATGAMERPVPIPGWTLPGVMGAGAVQTLLKGSAIVPDRPVAIAGSGPLLYLVAVQLLRAGVTVAAVLDTSARPLLRAARHARAMLGALPQVLGGLAWLAELRLKGVPLIPARALRAEGSEALEAVSFETGGQRRSLAVGLLLLHEGVIPNIQITTSIRCAHRWNPVQAAWQPACDEWGATNLEHIAVAGDGAGIRGAVAAAALGRLAALDAACRLGRIKPGERDARAGAERAALARQEAFRGVLDALYPPSESVAPLDDATIACRCEEVTAGRLRALVAEGFSDLNQLKSYSRCGMGPCQGRMCAPTAARLLAESSGRTVEEVGHYRLRLPVKPLPIQELAGLGNADRNSRPVLPVAAGDPSQRI